MDSVSSPSDTVKTKGFSECYRHVHVKDPVAMK